MKSLGWGRGPSKIRVQADEEETVKDWKGEASEVDENCDIWTSEKSVLRRGVVNCANWHWQTKQDENCKLITGYGNIEDTDQYDKELFCWSDGNKKAELEWVLKEKSYMFKNIFL